MTETFTEGSKNVFADLGLTHPEQRKALADTLIRLGIQDGVAFDEIWNLVSSHIEVKSTTRKKRDRALSDLAEIIEGLWGKRCSLHEAGCHCCLAWTMFDAIVKLTDAVEV
jgi:hypothetical protein